MSHFFDDFADYLNGKNSPITADVNSTTKGDANTRMDIYRHAYVYRLLDILADDFPTIYQILGTDNFFHMGEAYLKRYPSTSFTVRHFGQHLAKFLSETEPYQDHAYLWQIADFEWAKGSVFDAPDSHIFTLEQRLTIPAEAWGEVSFTFIPALKRLNYNYNVPQIWQAIAHTTDDDKLPEPTHLDEPLAWVLWRKDFNPHWYSMDSIEDAFFIQARRGVTFGELCQQLGQVIDDEIEITHRAAQFVHRWISEGMLSKIA